MCDDSCVVRYGRVFVCLTIFLISFVPITSHIFIFSYWLPFHPDRSVWLWVGPFYLGVISIITNYYLACTTDPGRVPSGYAPPLFETRKSGKSKSKSSSKEVSGTSASYKARWCKICLCYKPPRTHHCSYCKRCVLRMDHHCPWLNTCVGHHNIPHFLRFLLSVSFSASWCIGLFGMRLWDLIHFQNELARIYRPGQNYEMTFYSPPATGKELIFMIINLIILFLLLLTVGILGLWQLWYVSRNVTTIDSLENSKIKDLQKKGKLPADLRYPFDLGRFNNLKMVFGSHVWAWLFPAEAPGDGVTFQVNQYGDLVDMWPPKEYFHYKKYPYGKPTDGRKVGNDATSSDEDYDSVDEGDDDDDETYDKSFEDEEEPLSSIKERIKRKIT